MSKILYAASVAAHLYNFHIPYIEALRAEGHEVVTLANGDGVDINVPFEKRIISKTNRKCKQLLTRIIEEGSYDAIIVHTSLAAFHIRRALPKDKRPRLVNVVHGYLFPEFAKGLRANIRRLILLFAERTVRKKTDALVLMNAEDLRIAVTNNLISGTPYLINGMGVPAPKLNSTPEQTRASLGLEGKYLLTFAGELSERKNQSFLIEAMPDILRSVPNAHLCLAGDGAMREHLLQLIVELNLGDSVTLLGQRSDVPDLLAASDIYVSASRSEGLPFNIVEALSVGQTVIASGVKGHEDVLADGGGILYEDGNRAEFVKAVLSVYSKETVIDKNKIRDAFLRFSFDEVFPKTYAVIKEAAGI